MPPGPTPPLSLRAMTLMEILDASFRIYRDNFALFLGIIAIPSIPLVLSIMAMQAGIISIDPQAAQRSPFQLNVAQAEPVSIQGSGPVGEPSVGALAAFCGGLVVTMALVFIAVPIAKGALTQAISQRYLGRPVTVSSSYKALFSVILMYLVTIFLSQLVVGLGFMPLGCALVGPVVLLQQNMPVAAAVSFIVLLIPTLIPGFLLYAMFGSFVSQIMMVEGTSGTQALGRNMALSRGCRWKIVWLLLIQALIGSLLSSLVIVSLNALIHFTGLIESPRLLFVLDQGITQMVNMTMEPLWSVAWILLYFDARIRKEGFDLQILARRMAPAAERPARAPSVGLASP